MLSFIGVARPSYHQLLVYKLLFISLLNLTDFNSFNVVSVILMLSMFFGFGISSFPGYFITKHTGVGYYNYKIYIIKS